MPLTKDETDRFVDVNGIKIHYNEAGSGPALICTHGGGPGANAWDNTRYAFDALAQHFRTILMDLPGFGESQMHVSRDGVPMDFFLAKLQRDFMDLLGIDRAHLYGSSAFSATTLRFGLEYPDRTNKLVIQAFSAGAHVTETEGLKSLIAFAQNPVRENMETMVRYFTPRAEFRTEAFVDARFAAALRPGHLESRREFSVMANSPDLKDELGKLKAPVLVLWGYADGMIPVAEVMDDLQRIPDVRAHIWGGQSGHFVALEHADEFARLLIDFLTH
jgi:pimeloyl-ACP methyl ester carboxylesterase